jgi:hypothetical protein
MLLVLRDDAEGLFADDTIGHAALVMGLLAVRVDFRVEQLFWFVRLEPLDQKFKLLVVFCGLWKRDWWSSERVEGEGSHPAHLGESASSLRLNRRPSASPPQPLGERKMMSGHRGLTMGLPDLAALWILRISRHAHSIDAAMS